MVSIYRRNRPSSILCMLILTCSIIKTSVCFCAEITNQENEICILMPKTFIEHEKHHINLTLPQRNQLINKGYMLLSAILDSQEYSFPHKLEYLSHHKDFNDHWKIPGFAYGDRSSIRIVTDLVRSPINLVVDTVSSCLWNQEETTDSSPSDHREEYRHVAQLESVISLIWALYDISFKTKNSFLRGSILIEDGNKKIHNFLEKYCCYALGLNNPDQLMIPLNPQSSNLTYNRNYIGGSSHFVGRTLTQYGIDSRFRVRNFAIGVFPFSMSHLLFGRVHTTTGEELTFIKVEEEGLGDNRAIARHTINYGFPVPKTGLRREKDIPVEVAEAFICLINSLADDFFKFNLTSFFLEDLPDDATKQREMLKIQELLRKSDDGLLNIYEFQNSLKIDIAWMYKILWDIRDSCQLSEIPIKGSKKMIKNCDNLLEIIKKFYVEKTLFMRTGNEVLYSDEELEEALKKGTES